MRTHMFKHKSLILRIFIGISVIMLLSTCSYYIAKVQLHKYYYHKLEKEITEKYMDGYTSKGYCSYVPPAQIQLNKPGFYRDDVRLALEGKCQLLISSDFSTCDIMHGHTIWYYPILDELSNESNYKLWAGLNGLKFIVLQKTNRGFDFFEERINGVGFKHDITESYLYSNDIVSYKDKKYLVNFKLGHEFVSNLLNDKYKETSFDYTTYEQFEKLKSKSAWTDDVGQFYRNSKYYELRFDDYYDDILNSSAHRFGNQRSELYYTSLRARYAIYPIGNVLDKEIRTIVCIVTSVVILLHVLICTLLYIRKRSREICAENINKA